MNSDKTERFEFVLYVTHHPAQHVSAAVGQVQNKIVSFREHKVDRGGVQENYSALTFDGNAPRGFLLTQMLKQGRQLLKHGRCAFALPSLLRVLDCGEHPLLLKRF